MTEDQGRGTRAVWDEERDPRTLRPYPRNAAIYDERPEEDESLRESIATVGLNEPPLIDERGVIIAGHRRVAATIALGWATIPVRVRRFTDDEERERHEPTQPTHARTLPRPASVRPTAPAWTGRARPPRPPSP